MDDWFSTLGSAGALPPDAARALERDGFVVLPGPVLDTPSGRLAKAYDAAIASSPPSDVRVGRSSTRVDGIVSRGPELEGLYVHPPLLEACGHIIGRPFRLSTLHARTLHASVPADALHVDVSRDSAAWPLVGFILMVDAFRPDNGATRFVPGSHRRPNGPGDTSGRDVPGGVADPEVPACGPAGSLLIFHGSTWHGHSANVSGAPRRSIQGAFIPRDGPAAVDWGARLGPDTITRLGALARYLLALRD
jgi:Phytanoyl-CoA dioxygenase (PhyH)